MACLAAVSVYTTHALTSLNTEVTNERKDITLLQQRVKNQQAIISRFNSSITNADVEIEVAGLKKSLLGTEDEMRSEMQAMKTDITDLMNRTVSELDQTVTMAEAQINAEVKLVKGDVAQYVRTTKDQFSTENDFMKFQLAGTFTLLSCLISMWHMTDHLRSFNNPFVQRKILAILWMSPLYGITSWLSLVFPTYEGYLAIIKDFYEAYVIYQFLSFLISVMGKDRDEVVDMLAINSDHLEPPMRCCGWCRGKYPFGSPKTLADDILLQCQVFAMQFVFFKPVTAIALFTCNTLGYGADASNFYLRPQFWLNIVQNISVFTAFSGLIKFYHLVQEDLEWCKPFPKFLTIKGVVFMTFWQGLVISFLARATVETTKTADQDSDGWGKQVQNLLICLEMLLFSIAHFYCFPTDEWRDGFKDEAKQKKTKFGDAMALGDFMNDLKLIMGGDQKKKKMLRDALDDKADTDEEDGGGDNVNSVIDNDNADENSDLSLSSSDAAANRILCMVNSEFPDHTSTQSMGSVPITEEELEPDETSNLLGHANEGNDEILRPSIFTSL